RTLPRFPPVHPQFLPHRLQKPYPHRYPTFRRRCFHLKYNPVRHFPYIYIRHRATFVTLLYLLRKSKILNRIPVRKRRRSLRRGGECGQQEAAGLRLRTNTENKPHSLLLAIGSPLGCAKVLIMRESLADGAPISSWGSRLKTSQSSIWENSPI